MTEHPPAANDPGPIRPDDGPHQQSERSGADQRPAGQSTFGPPLELSALMNVTSTPFAWQHGARLYLLVSEWSGWVLAELEFVPSECHYVEIRRTSYRWPREAVGALLSRALPAGADAARQLVDDVRVWLASADGRVPAPPSRRQP